MPKYKYKCETCNYDYVEIRDIDHPQTFTNHSCGEEYILIGQE